MILVISDNQDRSTNEVLKWLDYYNMKWIRINEDDDIKFHALEYKCNKIEKFIIEANSRFIDLVDIDAYWYRRGWLNTSVQQSPVKVSEYPKIDFEINGYLEREFENLKNFIHSYLVDEKISINSFLTRTNNKTYYQFVAASVGIDVPDTAIVTEKDKVEVFFQQSGCNAIIKSINEGFSFRVNSGIYYSSNYSLSEKDINTSAGSFFPTLFQRYTEKFVELRIFYLNEKTYTMAIFSQANEKTKLDFRRYDYSRPNRKVPFKLPVDVESKIIKMMKRIDLNCGSIDMILTPENKFVFLEVNPVGQFGMVSYPCNYNLERIIAKTLCNERQELSN